MKKIIMIQNNLLMRMVTIFSIASLLAPIIFPALISAETNSPATNETSSLNNSDSIHMKNPATESSEKIDSSILDSEDSENVIDLENEKQKTRDSSEMKVSPTQTFSEKKVVPVYDEVNSRKYIHTEAIVIEGIHDLYTEPGNTIGSNIIGKSSQYLNQKMRVLQEKVTNRATWSQVWLNGKTIGWMNKKGLQYTYDTIQSTVVTRYNATVNEGFHDIYSQPGYTNGNEIIGKSSSYLNKTVQISEEKKTSRATWVLISQNNKKIGWMNKAGLKIQIEQVISNKNVHYDTIINYENRQIFSAPGYTTGSKIVDNSTNYLGQSLRVNEQKETKSAKWLLVSKNGRNIGWMNQDDLTLKYDSVLTDKLVHFDGVVTEGYHDIYSVPGYTKGNEIVAKSSMYLNKDVRIIQEISTNRATWNKIAINGKTIGWVNKIGLKVKMDAILSTNQAEYYATVKHNWHDIYTNPGYTKGNELVGKSSAYLNQEVKIIQEKTTNRAIWVQLSMDDKVIGWMNKIGIESKSDNIISSMLVHYDGKLTMANKNLYSLPGYTKNAKVIGTTSTYLNHSVRVTEQKKTNRGVWFKINLTNGKQLGWVAQKDFALLYDTVKDNYLVHYDATISQGNHDIYTNPGYTENNEIIAKSISYLNKDVRIMQEKVTDRAIWNQISINGKTVGWMNKKGLKLKYDTITSTNTVNIEAEVIADWHDIYSIPGYTLGNKIVGKSSSYLNKNVKIVQEKTAKNRAIWALIEKDGNKIGWVNKDALSVVNANYSDVITSSQLLHYEGTVTKSNEIIYSAPGFTSNSKEIGKTNSYMNKSVKITQEKITDRATWVEFSLNGKLVGWMNKKNIKPVFDNITNSKELHYEGTIVEDYHDIYTTPGYTKDNKIVSHSSTYLNQKVRILEEKVTKRATWVLISINGKSLGWMNKVGVKIHYDEALNNKTIHHNATIKEGFHDIYTVPGYMKDNQVIAKSANYLNKNVLITHTLQTKRANWAKISINGKVIGWMNISGLAINYDTIISTKNTSYNAKVIQGNHDVYTAPGYTQGNQIIGQSSSYLNKSVKVLQEKKTNRATWALISLNGKTIGWMNKNGLKSVSIYLDPGHGGTETGAFSGGVKEKDINLKVALKIEKLLISNGYDVVMSRKTDKFVSLSNRAQEANKLKTDIFVSVHHNSFIGTSKGIETYAYNRQGDSSNPMSNNSKRSLESGKLSNAVHQSLLHHSGALNRGTRTADFHVIRETNMPAILMELGYMDNASERAKLVNDAYQNKLAKGAYEGIVQYFK